jgi:hypothetical protein
MIALFSNYLNAIGIGVKFCVFLMFICKKKLRGGVIEYRTYIHKYYFLETVESEFVRSGVITWKTCFYKHCKEYYFCIFLLENPIKL